jgi:RNA polymerase sigma factor (sigma-70 family)
MNISADQNLFLEYSKTKNNKVKNEIAIKNQKLVTYVVNRFYNKKKEHKDLREDLLQEGRIGLLSAIDGFKPELGFQFSTYATWWIKQSINNYLLNQLPLIKVPSNVRTVQNKVLRKLREENMALKDLIEGNAATLEITEKMLKAINASLKSKWVSSLEDPVTSDSGNDSVLQDLISNPDEATLDSLTDYGTLKNCLKKSLAALPERERFILLLRYNIIDSVSTNNIEKPKGE